MVFIILLEKLEDIIFSICIIAGLLYYLTIFLFIYYNIDNLTIHSKLYFFQMISSMSVQFPTFLFGLSLAPLKEDFDSWNISDALSRIILKVALILLYLSM